MLYVNNISLKLEKNFKIKIKLGKTFLYFWPCDCQGRGRGWGRWILDEPRETFYCISPSAAPPSWEYPQFSFANNPFACPWTCGLVGGELTKPSPGECSYWLTSSHVIGPGMGVSSSLSQWDVADMLGFLLASAGLWRDPLSCLGYSVMMPGL